MKLQIIAIQSLLQVLFSVSSQPKWLITMACFLLKKIFRESLNEAILLAETTYLDFHGKFSFRTNCP